MKNQNVCFWTVSSDTFYSGFIMKPEYRFDVRLLIIYKFRKVFAEMLAQFKTNVYLCTVISFKGDTSLLLI